MKRFLWLKHCSIVMLLILSLPLGAKEAKDTLKDGLVHDQYKGVKFKISDSVIKEYTNAINTITANPSKYPAGIENDITNLLAIQSNLSARFTEMVDTYNMPNNKSKLPSCLSNGLDRFLKELAAGTKILDIWWFKGYPEWQYLTGSEEGGGRAPSADTIKIWTAFKKIMVYYPPSGEERYVLTAGLLFHELVHTVKQVYPECFKDLNAYYKETEIPIEELSADWAARNIFGEKLTKTVYIDQSGDHKTDLCTYEIVCKCKCEEKAGKKFSELASADSDEGCEPDPPEGPAGDRPDDNYSYFRGVIKEYNLAPEALIFTSGHWQDSLKLLGGLEFDENNTAEKLLKVTPFLVIPTGALSSMEYNSTFKYILEQYVNLGGSIIVFGQQYGAHIDNVVPVPEGESLKSYGWREDQSCLRFSSYFETNHPVLSSSTNELINAGIDGYFSTYPSNATTLLLRKVNREPALLYYPYGNGTVILTSLYTDWAYAHSQATKAELRIIRDLITFAKNPKLPIPMFDLEQNPTPSINLNVEIKNITETPASKAKLMVYTPARNILLYELEVPVNLNPGETTQTAINFTLPELQTKDYGICHVDYELYNAENEIIQLPTESDNGRFSVYKIITPVTLKDEVRQWLTVKDENVYWGQDVEVAIHFKNATTETKTLDFNNPFININHDPFHIPFPSFQVVLPPGGEYQHHVSIPTSNPQLSRYAKQSITIRFQAYDANGVLKPTAPAKAIFLLGTMTNSTLKLNTPSPIVPGGTFNYSFSSWYVADPMPGITSIKLILEKYNFQDSKFNEIQTLYQVDHDYNQNNSLTYNGTYTPDPVLPTGNYRLKLEVTTANGAKEEQYQFFQYSQSNFQAEAGKIQKNNVAAWLLIPGETYTIPLKLKNTAFNSTYNIKNGSVLLTLESSTGQTVFNKEITGITLNSGEEQERTETFVFTPTQNTETGTYTFHYRYWDETFDRPIQFSKVQSLGYRAEIFIKPDKLSYRYADAANIQVAVSGAGGYTLHFTCAEAGINETRTLQMPEGNYNAAEMFQFPIGAYPSYNISIELLNSFGLVNRKTLTLPVEPLVFDYRGNFASPYARAGENINLNINIKEISGMTNPLPGRLLITCNQYNYQTTQDVILQPLTDNSFIIPVPVPADAPLGSYRCDVQLKISDFTVLEKQHSFSLLGAAVEFTSPGDTNNTYNAGDALTLNAENIGGKPGNFDIEILIRDSRAITVFQLKQTYDIAPGSVQPLTLTLPGSLKPGAYQVTAKANETTTSKLTADTFALTVSGLSASLNAYTLKENYPESETITGKAEITAAGAIENGTLKAQITHYVQSQGMEEESPGEFLLYNLIDKAVASGTKLYLSTDKGIVSYDQETGNITTLYSFTENQAFNSLAMTVSSNGELWIATPSYGVFRRDTNGQWINYSADEVGSYLLRDIIEITTPGVSGSSEIWTGGNNGVSVFRNGQWVYYTTYDNPNGLISNDIYKFAVDGRGGIWLSTFAGLCRFNGSQFEAVSLPTLPAGKTPLPGKLTGTPDGSIWVAASDTLYRFRYPSGGQGDGEWQTWSFSEIYPPYTLSIQQLENVNGELWLKFQAKDVNNLTSNILVRYNGNFIVFPEAEIPGLSGLNNQSFVFNTMSEGDSCYFTCEVGFLEYNFTSGSWSHRMLELDSHKLASLIYCLAKDSLGRLWAGTKYGMSMFDGNQWHNYYRSAGGQLLLDITMIDTDSQDNIYGYSRPLRKIIKLDSRTGIVQLLSLPSGYVPYYPDRMAVENSGRIWLGRASLYYYEDSQWTNFTDIWPSWPSFWGSVNALTKDTNGGGGVWVSTRDGASSQVTSLYYIKDRTINRKFTSPTLLLPLIIERLYKDGEGKLWLRYSLNNAGKRPLYSFDSIDGATWTNYSSYEGFPTKGVINFVKDGAGRLLIIDSSYTYYALENNRFVSLCKNSSYINNSMVFTNGKLYSSGQEHPSNYPYAMNLLKVSFAGSIVEQELWGQTYNVNPTSGESGNIDLLSNKTLAQGSYTLKTELLSPLGQSLADTRYNFQVKSETISVTLTGETDNTSTNSTNYLKPNEPRTINIEIQNNTANDASDLPYTLKQISPSGTEEILAEQTLNLTAGQSFTDTLTFNESETGTWRLKAQVGTQSSCEMLLEVTEPSVSMTINAPTYAGDEPFTININLKNEGKIGAEVRVGSQGLLDENITLEPGEEKVLTFSDTISADTNYTITISGDVEKTETSTVKYGYTENLSLNVLPTYREGPISINYTLANPGGLPFTDTLHFELFNEGASLPLFTFDKTYNLYPGESPINDSLNFSLPPGPYQLKWKTAKLLLGESLFTVLPSGLGNISLSTSSFPTGSNQIPFTITNTDTTPGLIPITITIFGDDPTTPILSETRNYYLLPNQSLQDFIETNFPTKSNYSLSISGSKIPTPIITPIQFLNPNETSATLTIGTPVPPETNHIPITIDIANPGYNPFNGTLIIDASGIRSEEPISINPNSSLNQTFPIETASLNAGNNNIKVFLNDASGNTISQTTSSVTITGPDIRVTEVPQNLEINAGQYADVTLKLKNEGNLRGQALLKISAFDTLYQEREISLEPGAEIILDGISIDTPADCPTGNYPFNYRLTGPGVSNTLTAGNFTFKVNGLSLNVDASLDRSLYNIGETAQLTLSITSPTPSPSDAPLEAMVNWGNFSEKRAFALTSGSASLVFEIPLDEKREEKVFYGIYHEGGKGIHLNDIYLNFKDKISVDTDKQVYAPGEVIHTVFTLTDGLQSDQSGLISVNAFGETQTLALSSSVSASFQVPADTFGGTYGISWRFVPSDTSQEELSGSHSFDVSGLVVKVAKSELEKGNYSPGETIKAAYTFEANRDDTLALRCWITTPSNNWTYLGETSVSVSADKQTNAVSSNSFTTTEAGAHELVYGLYKDDNLVVSGRMAFDVGDAVLIGIATDKFEYKDGSENVIVKVEYFGKNQETLSRKGFLTSQSFSLFLDNEKIEERTLTIDGPGYIEITLNSSRINGGSHLLKGVLTGDNLTSTKQTSFLYGTNLPDLTLSLTNGETGNEGLNYTYQITATNRGKTTSPATTLTFTDNGNIAETVSIPSLASGASQENIFNWSGSGKAGSHEFLFEIDPMNTVKEYSEANNQLTLSEEVPLLFYNLEVEPIIWPANSDINIITRLINNQNSIVPLTLILAITNESTGTAIFQRTHNEELPAFGSKALNDHFNTGVTPAGEYTLAQDIVGDNINLHKEINVHIEVTKIISATLQLLPVKIPSGVDAEVEMTMTLKNIGNVLLEEETATIEVVNKESQESVKAEQLLFTVPLGQEVTEKKVMALNLVEGAYEVRLKYLDNVIITTELTAAAAIKPEKTIAVKPRVLVMNLQTPGIGIIGGGNHQDSVAFLSNILQAAEIQYEVAQGILETYFRFHKGYTNINILLGNTVGRKWRDEIKERIWRGEELILIANNPINVPDMVEWLGVSVTPLTGKEKAQPVVEILSNELSAGGQVVLMGKNRLMLEKKSADVFVVGQTQQEKKPMMTYRKYGNGHILVIAAPVGSSAYKSGGEIIAQLLINVVNFFSNDIYTISTLSRVLPVEISLDNEGAEDKTLTLKEIFPYGVEGTDYSPALEDTGDEKEIKWNIKVSGGATENISYWLKLPDQAGSYEVKTEIYEGETKLEEVSLNVDVSQTVLSRIIDVLAELEALEVSGHDANEIHRAKVCLENIRNRSVGSLADHLLNLHDAVQATESIGSVVSVDVSALRLKAGDIMVIIGRRLYEEIKQWGSSRLNPLSGMITME